VAAVFTLCLAWFSLGVEQSGLASVYCDPVSRIDSQDEAVYGREAIDMAAHGNWLTPMYLGRYALNKPPLAQVLMAASVKVFGVSAWALRLPSMIAAALTAALLFAMVRRSVSLAAAAGATLLLISSHLFYVFSRLAMTDMLLALWTTAAMFVLTRDPALARRSSFWLFAACSGLAILTKAAAGCLPLVALAIHAAIAPKDNRPRIARVAAAAAAACAIALPWHLYQLLVHPRWFWAEYVLQAHLSVGVTAPPQYSSEPHPIFYARRLFLMDPVLTAAAALALVPVLLRPRLRPVVLAWTGAVLAALLGFRYRSAYYLLPLIPALAMMAAELFQFAGARVRALALAALAVCAVFKTASASPVWGVPAGTATERAAAPALERYCDGHRGNGLVLVEPDDEFLASVLPIARVRYCLLDSRAPSEAARPPLDFAWLGVSVSADQFNRMADWLPVFRDRLASFGLPSDAPVATVIRARSLEEIAQAIEAHPETDFSLPRGLLRSLRIASPHRVVEGGLGRVFLLSPSGGSYEGSRPCRL
jgi:hypothetical protein